MNGWPDCEACRERQQRLIHEMERLDILLSVVTRSDHVEWLNGPFFSPLYQSSAALSFDGRLTMVVTDTLVPRESAAYRMIPDKTTLQASL